MNVARNLKGYMKMNGWKFLFRGDKFIFLLPSPSLSLLSFIFLFFLFLISCGRAWRGDRLFGEEFLIVPKTSEIYSIEGRGTDSREWDFTLDPGDIPHIAIYDFSRGGLLYFTLDAGGEWKSEFVDPAEGQNLPIAGRSPNIFFVGDKIHIVYLATSPSDKIPKFYIIKEAFRDELGRWRCRVIKKWDKGVDIPYVRAGYLFESHKIVLYFLDPVKNVLVVGSYSPDYNADLCILPSDEKIEEFEKERSDFSYGYIYYFGGGDVRVKAGVDPRCNPIGAKIGTSMSLVPSFSRQRVLMSGFVLYDPVLTSTLWIEFRQSDFNTWKNDITFVSFSLWSGRAIDLRQGAQCDFSRVAGFDVDFPVPFREIKNVRLRNSGDETFLPVERWYIASSRRIFVTLPENVRFPVEVSVEFIPLFEFEGVNIGSNRTFVSADADRNGIIHIGDFSYLPPLYAVEYGRVEKTVYGFAVTFYTVDGGGGGLFTEGTAGVGVAASSNGIPVIAYFSPSTNDLKIAIPLESTWRSSPIKTGSASGISPKILLTKDQNTAVVLAPTLYIDRFSLFLLFVPLTF